MALTMRSIRCGAVIFGAYSFKDMAPISTEGSLPYATSNSACRISSRSRRIFSFDVI
jgi:hypothetical protein